MVGYGSLNIFLLVLFLGSTYPLCWADKSSLDNNNIVVKEDKSNVSPQTASLTSLPNFIGQTLTDENNPAIQRRILSTLGEGGYHIVYLAEDPKTGKRTALKRRLHKPIEKQTEDFEQGFSAHLSNKAPIIPFLGKLNLKRSGSDIAEEFREYTFINGPTLSRLIFEDKQTAWVIESPSDDRSPPVRLSPWDLDKRVDKVLSYFWDMIDALILLGQDNLLHRDIKPLNIMIYLDPENQKKRALLGDFDLLTQPHLLDSDMAGTPTYMASDFALYQLDQLPKVTCSADAYSLAVTFLAAITGRNPMAAFFKYLHRTGQLSSNITYISYENSSTDLLYFIASRAKIFEEFVSGEVNAVLETWSKKEKKKLIMKVKTFIDFLISATLHPNTREATMREWLERVLVFNQKGAIIGRKDYKGRIVFGAEKDLEEEATDFCEIRARSTNRL